ncbi:hypothetical protein [Nocardia salmonicida]|uniref:hypothetical protein n=1 Tax=Nocardia salmonicida TaxID=53431 RepID=UPI003787788D
MTRQTMLAAARRLPRPDIYGIGICRDGNESVDYEIGWDDLDRDIAWAHQQLLAAGVTAADHVLITCTNHEAPWLSPVVRALRRIGAVYTPAETYSWDAARFISVLERLPITVVIGLCGETLSAVTAKKPDLAALFDGVRLVWSRPEAHAELSAAGVPSLRMGLLGPALGLALPDAPDVLRVNAAEWVVHESDGALLVSATVARHASLRDLPTGIAGRVTVDGDTVLIEP